MACAAILRGHSEVTLRCHLDNKSRNSLGLDHKTHTSWGVVYQTIFWFGLWYRDLLADEHKSLVMLWCPLTQVSSKCLSTGAFINNIYFALIFPVAPPVVYQSVTYRRRCCVCVFAEHLRWHRLVSLGFEHVPPSLQWPPFSSQYFTHSCLFLSPNLPILCT